ncbi:hypothetical protein LVD17_08915 [Fulvivirga ulvae]|uniref:hypothetical protein n=1 Tax=Fulvivirga ulvae TaxID=2904245 RepID=UPI001F1BD55E|nr:hypothetical protein [Fulvivirga ulvae]UII33934.1 hypothetical protein LVD17_08915 [Fulvivirga ulvae]
MDTIMIKVRSLLLLGIMALAGGAWAQVPSAMKLESSAAISDGQEFPIESTIEVSGDHIVWTQYSQSGNSQETRFEIAGVNGDWDQNTNQGLLIYTVVIDESREEIIIKGTAESTEVNIGPNNQYTIRMIMHTITYN